MTGKCSWGKSGASERELSTLIEAVPLTSKNEPIRELLLISDSTPADCTVRSDSGERLEDLVTSEN